MTRRKVVLGPLAAVVACAPAPGPRVAPDPSGFPPSPAGLGIEPGSDAVWVSLLYTNNAFGAPATNIGNNPPYAARLVGMVEFLTAMILGEPRFATMPALVQPSLATGRAELRSVFGISETASPQAVITAFAGASAALARDDRAAAEASLRPVVSDPARTLATLGAVPVMPRLSFALSLAQRSWVDQPGIRLFGVILR